MPSNNINIFFKVGSMPRVEPNVGARFHNLEIKAWAHIKSQTFNWDTQALHITFFFF